MDLRRFRQSHKVKIAAAAACLGLFAAGCGSASDEGESADNGETGVGETGADVTIVSDAEPRAGGRLVYGLEAETDGLRPDTNRWAVSGVMLAWAVFDPLAAFDADGVARPYLAESIEPNDDYTVWTVVMRDGVVFHDGEPLTSDALKATLDAHLRSGLTSSAVAPIEEVVVIDELTAEVRMNQPWVAFPAVMTAQAGVIVSPKMVPAVQPGEDGEIDPDELAAASAAADEFTRDPIGTGPFVQVDWQSGNRWLGEKNADYWREGMPYLDELEFRPLADIDARSRGLVSPNPSLDVAHATDVQTIARWRETAENDNLQLIEDRGEAEESFVMLNTASEGPLGDVRVRQAIAHATDVEGYNQSIDLGITRIATSPFTPDSPWFAETDYPEFDLDAARALVDEYTAETGEPVTFTLATVPSPAAERAVQTLAEMWAQAGITANLITIDQTEFINTAIIGNYEANLWRQFGTPDPDADAHWWLGWAGTTDEGEPRENILNFARNRNPQIDEALQRGRQNPDETVRVEAYAEFQQLLNEDLPYIWLNHTLWAVGAQNDVRDLASGDLPNGEASAPMVTGAHRLTQTWLER